MPTDPTVVVGVGQAGIRVSNVLAEIAEENHDRELFEFVAIDTDTTMLSQRPDGGVGIHLGIDTDCLSADVSACHYLTQDMANTADGQGTMRQRSLGRYALEMNYFEVYRTLRERIQSHYEAHATDSFPGTNLLNIHFIHSMGGGTGSGAFPLLAAMLDRLAETLETNYHSATTYLSGVGVVPLITFDPAMISDPVGDERSFPNTYAALNDLNTLEELASSDESRTLRTYAPTLGSAANMNSTPSPTEFELNSPPFNDYWLFGVDEATIQGETTSAAGGRSYAERVNQTIARPLHAISKNLPMRAVTWSMSAPYIGSFDQSEVRVPHEEVLGYYDLQIERDSIVERVEDNIPEEIADMRTRYDEFDALKQAVDEAAVVDSELDPTVREQLDQTLPAGAALVEMTAEDIEGILDKTETDHGIEGTIIATSLLRDRLSDDRGLSSVKSDHKDTITDLWSTYNMSTKPKFGGQNADTIEAKAAGLREFIRAKIDEYTDIVDNWEPGPVDKVLCMLPPHGPFESERQEAERILQTLRESRDELDRVESEWGRISDMRQAAETRRQDVRTRIDQRMGEIDEKITRLQTERDELRRDINQLEYDLEATRQSLATEQTNKRLALLPIEVDALDEIDPQNAEAKLTSIYSYEQHGLITRKKLRLAINQCVDFADADSNRRVTDIDYNFDEHRKPKFSASKDTWFLYHEDNEAFKSDISRNVSGRTLTSGEQSQLDYLSDPYRIEFISFYRRGPVPGLTFYQQLAELAEDGTLDGYAHQYSGDHRLAFAYPEWHPLHIRREWTDSISIEKPPEMNHSHVQKPNLAESEVKNWINSNGLDSYVWNGVMMDNYDANEVNSFTGWKQALSRNAVSFTQVANSTPSADLKNHWLQGAADWEEILNAYAASLREETGLKIHLQRE